MASRITLILLALVLLLTGCTFNHTNSSKTSEGIRVYAIVPDLLEDYIIIVSKDAQDSIILVLVNKAPDRTFNIFEDQPMIIPNHEYDLNLSGVPDSTTYECKSIPSVNLTAGLCKHNQSVWYQGYDLELYDAKTKTLQYPHYTSKELYATSNNKVFVKNEKNRIPHPRSPEG